MANKMISEKDLHDEFLSGLLKSEQPVMAPENFSAGIMERIGLLPARPGIKPYVPPFWLKWGVPGVALASLLILLITRSGESTPATHQLPTLNGQQLDKISSWFSGFKPDITMPSLDIPATALWVIAGGVVLTWAFLLLARFLEKKVKS